MRHPSRRASALRPSLRTLAAAALLLATAPAAAQQPTRAEQIRVMDSIAASPLHEGRVAGLAVAVVRGADTLLMKAYGEADLEWDVPLPIDAVFEIGSVTKQFTAAAVLKLRDEGKLDLDADVTQYLTDYPTHGRGIPLRRLLDHTSGIKGYTEMQAFGALRTRALPRDSLVALFAAEPFDFEPGDALIYNNSAYFLLGLVIEQASGMSYADYVEKHLFAPLGMTRSMYCSNDEVVPRRAHGYDLEPEGLVRAPYIDHTWPYSAGSLCSSVGDLITWLRALHGGKVLPEASYREMITPGRLNDGTPVRYAMGLSVTPDPWGRPMIHHGGGIPGFVSETRYYPEEDLYVVMLINTTGNASPSAFSNELVDVLLPRVAVERREFEGDVAPLLGTYSGPARGRPMSVEITASGAGIAASVNGSPALPLRWIDGWTFEGPGRLAIFERADEDGPAMVLRVDSGGGHYVLRRQADSAEEEDRRQ